jgi:DNA polymerase
MTATATSGDQTTAIGHLDFETFSELDVRKVGAYRYARHPSTEVLICAWQLPGMTQPAVWLPRTQRPPARLMGWVRGGGRFGAHNAAFERCVWRWALSRQHPDIPEVKDSQWVCTAAKAAASGLPRSLEKALKAMQMPVLKDEEGAKLINVFCKPRKPTKKDPRTRILPEHDVRFQRFIEYCQQDVRGEVALDNALPDLIPRQRRMFILDMAMNDRGLPIDLPLVKKALGVVQALERDIAAQVQALTGGVRATQVAKMLELFAERGLDLENMRKETITQALKDDTLDETTKRLLELRVEAGKASTKKLVSMLACADPDDWVVQGGFLYHGAHTGRYAGRLVQPHNFIRGLLKDWQQDLVFGLLDMADPDLFTLLFEGVPFTDKKGDPVTTGPIDVISQCMRGFIRAPYGYELAVVDYTAIEARVLAWVAGEDHMLEAYFAGVDVYKLMAKKLWKLATLEEVTDEQRRIAKNLVLGCGYQLGGVKFVDYCANAGLIIEPDFAMSAVKAYRKEHPAICESWKTVESLVVGAIKHPGVVYRGLRCKFFMRDHWLCIQLPSGREIRYPYARAVPCERWGKPAHEISFRTEIKGQFLREKTYGGKLIENIVQGIAFDCMQEGMLSADTNGYPVHGTVHDELITLRVKGTSDVKELEKIVCEIKPWMKGIPLAAKGFVTERYKKD